MQMLQYFSVLVKKKCYGNTTNTHPVITLFSDVTAWRHSLSMENTLIQMYWNSIMSQKHGKAVSY